MSHLYAATLKHLASVEIVWVSSVGAHLQFDPTVSTLYLFSLPSFCRLHETRDSIIGICVGLDHSLSNVLKLLH
jgi:hypothetical protein